MKIISPDYNFFRPAYWFGQVDARPLGLFRIFFAGLLLKSVFYLLFLADEFFSDDGVLPRELMWRLGRQHRFSLMDAMPEAWMARVFFLLWMLVLIGLLLGYHTRLMTILNFIILISVHERNFLILNGADLVLRVLSFWAMFIPLGKAYSLDVLIRRWRTFRITRNTADLQAPPSPPITFALPVRLIQIQIALVYIFTFILKLPGKPWRDGTALFYALQVQSLALPTGDWLLENAPLSALKFGTYFSMVMEGGFVFFVFLPLLQPGLRAFGLLLGMMMHLGIAMLMAIQDFSLVMLIAYFVFWDARWVDALSRYFTATSAILSLPAANSPRWLLLTMTRSDRLQLVDKKPDRETGEEALIQHLPFNRLWRWMLNISAVNNLLKMLGYWLMGFAVLDPLICPQPTFFPSYRGLAWIGRIILTLILIPAMVMVIWWNLTSVERDRKPIVGDIPETPRIVVQHLGLGQAWEMFAPYPTEDDGWITVPGQFENGLEIDLVTEEPLLEGMTHYYWGPEMRWRKYGSELWRVQPGYLIKAWGEYYCTLYNVQRNLPEGERLATLQIYYNWRWSHAPGKVPNPINHSNLLQYECDF